MSFLQTFRPWERRSQFDPWLAGLCLLILGLHAGIQLLEGGDIHAIYLTFGLSLEGLEKSNWWQLITYAFLHGPWWHVLLNVLALWMLGNQIVWIVGPRMVLSLLLSGVLTGGLFTVLIDFLGTQRVILVGISGGLCALIAFLATVSPEARFRPLPLRGRNALLGFFAVSLAGVLIDPSLGVPLLSSLGEGLLTLGLGDFFTFGHACHLGGLLAGLLTGLYTMRQRVTLATLQRQRLAKEKRELQKKALH